jgi:hypothetical protein
MVKGQSSVAQAMRGGAGGVVEHLGSAGLQRRDAAGTPRASALAGLDGCHTPMRQAGSSQGAHTR